MRVQRTSMNIQEWLNSLLMLNFVQNPAPAGNREEFEAALLRLKDLPGISRVLIDLDHLPTNTFGIIRLLMVSCMWESKNAQRFQCYGAWGGLSMQTSQGAWVSKGEWSLCPKRWKASMNPYKLSKLLKVSYIRDYIRDYHKGYSTLGVRD